MNETHGTTATRSMPARSARSRNEEWEDDSHEALGLAQLRELLVEREAATERFRELKRRLLRRR